MMRQTYSKGLVNILVPCYNGQPYIERFMRSLSEQSYHNIELIIVNDGSTDNSEELIISEAKKFLPSYIKLKYIFQGNKGIGGAIATALKQVRGEFFTWFNIDDILTKDCINLMVEFLNNNKDYALVRPNVFIVDEQDVTKVLYLINDNNPDAYKEYLFENAVQERNFTFGCSMIRTKIFDEVNPKREIYESRQGQNWQLLLPILYRHKSGYIDAPLYSVIEQQESTSRVKSYEKRIKQIAEYENILVNTVRQINMSESDKEKYINNIKNRYIHKRYLLNLYNGDYPSLKIAYTDLKNNGLLTDFEKRTYCKRFFRLEYWIYLKKKFLRNIKRSRYY